MSVFFSFAIVASFMILCYGSVSPEFTGIFIGSIIIILLGLVDDFVELSPVAKFFGQTLSVAALIIFGIVTRIAAIGFLGNILVTFFWMLAIINALNLLDIMDGLCCGITVIAAGAFLTVSFLSQSILSAVFCSCLIGASLGFLKYNLPPAKIYLGDTGSMFCGFILAAVAITIDYAPLKREIALATPILILGLPIFDTLFVILMRFLHGRPVIRKSRDHFALRLLASGLNKQKVLLVMYLFGLFFAVSALLISKVSNQQGIIILIAIALICAIALRKIGAIKIGE
ncbi:MAG: undecaprenyl/decaprenyl-phosphate alpha-N-acetylglucosaminyl 1-phosphate transferase [Candidatus Omnitrophica bacterium]|nr:undecaprenyl/decaprenyl-phosphate alpha-N-acetylglucosaminyl 1-phosphate transferase [Candidatus Omnitrophota bacterium]